MEVSKENLVKMGSHQGVPTSGNRKREIPEVANMTLFVSKDMIAK